MLDPIRHIDPSSIKDVDSFRDIVKLLLNIVEQQSEQLRQENQELKDEINRLKGEHGRSKFPKPKGPAAKDISSEKQRRRKNRKKGKKKPNINIDRVEMSIVETAAKLQVNALDYIADRITQKYEMPHLAALVRQAYS